MKKILAALLLVIIGTVSAHAQIHDPVKWETTVENIRENEATVVITAIIEPGWHLYSQFIEEGGPVPTSFRFDGGKGYELIGSVTESPQAVSEFDPFFNMEIAWHKSKVRFSQKIKLTEPQVSISGILEFMVCNDVNCLPPEEIPFEAAIDAAGSVTGSSSEKSLKNSHNQSPGLNRQQSSDQESSPTSIGSHVADGEAPASAAPEPVTEDQFQSRTLWGIFIAGLVGGIAAFLMPCIYPMVPLTVSFFTKQSVSRSKGVWNAVIYGISIIIIYVALGMVITLVFGASALNEAASSALFNLFFFAVIIVFAVSFLGAFEITLPSRFVNKVDSQSSRGGIIGIFFMAFTLALVSFSCTGPIIGYLLVEAVSKGSLLGPAIGMLGFSVALAVPFILFALFPSFLKEMPKSGGWLNTVKVSLGFLELALAFKFLSNVDLAYHWGILDREVFLAIWIAIFALFGLYLLGKLRLSDADTSSFTSLPRLFFALLVFSFTVYMVPGMWGAPLKGISAWLPPQTTQDFDLNRLTYGSLATTGDADSNFSGKKYAELFQAPHGLNGFYDYQEGLDHARKTGKPALVDFTGWSCVNCRKMEASVWPDPSVLNQLKSDYVLISLYVDDKTELEESEKYISSFSGKRISHIGQKWSDMQASVYGTNSQPYYVIVGHDGETLVPPTAFDLDIEKYARFLRSGTEAYKKKYNNEQQ